MGDNLYLGGYNQQINVSDINTNINGNPIHLNNVSMHGISFNPEILISIIDSLNEEQKDRLIKILFRNAMNEVFFKKVEEIING